MVINLRDGATLAQHAFARNTGGDLIHYWWRAEEGWQAVNRTFTGYHITSEPVVINLRSGDAPTQHVFARNNAGDLIHYWWWAQQGWRTENLTGYANIGAGYRIAGDPVVINLWSGDAPTQHAFARNVVGALIHYWWSAQAGWEAEDLTQYANIGNGFRIAGNPVVINLRVGDTPTQHAFGRNGSNELIHYWWNAQEGWQAESLIRYANIGNAFRIASGPVVVNFASGDAPTQHAFARNGDSELIHYWWRALEGWRAENLTRYANIGTAFRIANDPVTLNVFDDFVFDD